MRTASSKAIDMTDGSSIRKLVILHTVSNGTTNATAKAEVSVAVVRSKVDEHSEPEFRHGCAKHHHRYWCKSNRHARRCYGVDKSLAGAQFDQEICHRG